MKQEQVKQTQAPIPEYDEMVHRLLENLHVDEKRILLLRSIEEYSFDEIAAIMDMKAATVRKSMNDYVKIDEGKYVRRGYLWTLVQDWRLRS